MQIVIKWDGLFERRCKYPIFFIKLPSSFYSLQYTDVFNKQFLCSDSVSWEAFQRYFFSCLKGSRKFSLIYCYFSLNLLCLWLYFYQVKPDRSAINFTKKYKFKSICGFIVHNLQNYLNQNSDMYRFIANVWMRVLFSLSK